MHCSAIRCCQVWCSSIQGIYASVTGGQSAMGIHALFYIYRSAKFGVVVFKASMLDCKGCSSAIGICALFYIYIDLPSLV